MSLTVIAAIIFVVLALVAAGVQFALALGAPLGRFTMGGRWPEKLPPAARVGTVVQGGLMVAMARIVVGQAGLLAPVGPDWLIWVVVAIIGLSTLLNNITPSRPERQLWGPVTVVMFLAAIYIAI